MPEITNSQEALQVSKTLLASHSFAQYAKEYADAYRAALLQCNITEPNQLGDDPEKHGAFFQNFWEALPNNRNIRYGAFYNICEMGEWYCFGDR
jgi:hypothetical protein